MSHVESYLQELQKRRGEEEKKEELHRCQSVDSSFGLLSVTIFVLLFFSSFLFCFLFLVWPSYVPVLIFSETT